MSNHRQTLTELMDSHFTSTTAKTYDCDDYESAHTLTPLEADNLIAEAMPYLEQYARTGNPEELLKLVETLTSVGCEDKTQVAILEFANGKRPEGLITQLAPDAFLSEALMMLRRMIDLSH